MYRILKGAAGGGGGGMGVQVSRQSWQEQGPLSLVRAREQGVLVALSGVIR